MKAKLNTFNNDLRRNWISYTMGVGLVLFTIHSPAQPGLTYDPVTNTYSGIFLPHIGVAIVIACSFGILARGKITLGNKWAWIPLLIIVLSATARLFISTDMKTLTGVMFAVMLFAIYLACRKMGEDVFKPIAVAVIIQSISMVILGLTHDRTGGIICYPTPNYDIATGFMVFGSALAIGKRQWMVVGLALVGLLFAAGIEMVFAVGVIGIAVLIRRDWSKKLWVILGVGLAVMVILFATGTVDRLYRSTIRRVDTITMGRQENVSYPYNFILHDEQTDRDILITYNHAWEETLDDISHYRWSMWKRAISNIAPLGHGYKVTEFDFTTPHNVPLVIVDQLGIVAALAWLFMVFAGLIKTRWKYAYLAVIALSVADHYIWTNLALWLPALVGVSTVSERENDYIFKDK